MSSMKELVKKHFNLVDAPAKESFGEIMTADGQLTLTYEGEELAQGLAIFVVTEDGNVPAPDGEHALEGGITIVTADGKIEAIKETPAEEAPAEGEEVAAEEVSEEDAEMEVAESPAEAVAEVVADEVAEEVADVVEEAISEEVVIAVAEAVSEAVGEMMKKYEERMAALEGKFESFASAPAAEKTNARKSSTTKFKSDLTAPKNQALVEKFIALKNKK
jgi:hypothetical protein